MDLIPQSSQIPQTPKTRFPMVLTILNVLLLLSTAFLAYQNLQLKKQIASLQNSPIPPTTLISPTPSEISNANWKTYTNSKLGFNFRYPNELNYVYDNLDEYVSRKSSSANLLVQNFDGSKPTQNLTEDFQVVLYVSKADTTNLRDLAKNALSDSINPITISGREGIIGTSIQKNSKVTTVWINYSGNRYTIQLSTPETAQTLWFDQILSTFKFLDQPASYTCPPSGWQGCMPILSEEGKKACSPEAFAWYKTNCPDFKGGAL